MRVNPLVLHAAARIPALTDIFSERLPVASMTVTAGEKVILTTASSHGIAIGSRSAVCIVDAATPNKIVATSIHDGHYVKLTTEHDHDLSMTSDGTRPWNIAAKLAGFDEQGMNGTLQLVSVDGARQFTVLCASTISSLPLTGNEVLLERLEQGIIGWHVVTATSSFELQFDTPEDVDRSFSVQSPSVVTNVRIAGSVSLEIAQRQYVRGYQSAATTQSEQSIGQSWMFVCPYGSVQLSRDRNASSDAVIERTASSDDRRVLLDGYYVFVALPAESSGGGVAPSDLANGTVLSAVLRTFDGLNLPRREFYQGDTFVHSMIEHGLALGDYDGATYWHAYKFEAPCFLTQWDSIQPFEWPRIDEAQMTVASGIGPGTIGGALDTTKPITPVGSSPIRGIVFGPESDGYGIRHDDAPQPLTAIVSIS